MKSLEGQERGAAVWRRRVVTGKCVRSPTEAGENGKRWREGELEDNAVMFLEVQKRAAAVWRCKDVIGVCGILQKSPTEDGEELEDDEVKSLGEQERGAAIWRSRVVIGECVWSPTSEESYRRGRGREKVERKETRR